MACLTLLKSFLLSNLHKDHKITRLFLSVSGRADMVAASFSITKSRSAVIDFSAPYYYSGFAMMSIETESTETRYFSFLEPFPFITWIILMLAAVVSFFCLVSDVINITRLKLESSCRTLQIQF